MTMFISRRRLFQAGGALGIGSLLPALPAFAGTHFDLEIAETPVTIGGRKSMATALDGE